MDFFVINRERSFPNNGINVAYLKIDHWNDFSFVTMFQLHVFDSEGSHHTIGSIKIGFKGQDVHTPTYIKLDSNFSKLPSNFFALGLDLDFYKNASALGKKTYTDLLSSLNDLALNPENIDNIKDEDVFRVAFLRDASITSIKGQYARVLIGKPELTDFNFTFVRDEIKNAYPIKLRFKVKAGSTPSTNIHAIIGRNGCGKTTVLNGMIDAIMNPTSDKYRFVDNEYFSEPIEEDYFSSLISVSFSAFDPFTPPIEQPDPSKGTCYYYIGLKAQDGSGALHTLDELRADFIKALVDSFRRSKTRNMWFKAIESLGTDENFLSMDLLSLYNIYMDLKIKVKNKNQVDSIIFREKLLTKAIAHLSQLSSGHAIVLFTITKLIATIEEKTLILLDEPEGHLHPPLLSAFIRTLSELLFEQNGVAIIATHSPVVLQEVPSTCVWKINRVRDIINPYRLDIETFGENVGVLTREVFGLEVVTSGYHHLLSQSVKSGKSYNEILLEYNNELGMEARSVLKSLIINRDKESK
ncbi:TPA: AAA family ATPase [Aeromonas hydrophila]|uniref:ATP-dependent nuclease n=1 Tax=Aeromonas hydrophila TaxID=644 RepID=UPI0009BC048C|nr:AAA family ATPase [Aeromonas hydrophila]HAU4883845.1 AAA family ATPase [Aeromonas hydrophila]